MQLIIDSHATLQGAPAPVMDGLRRMFTLQNPKYKDAIKHKRWTKGIPKTLRFYKDTPTGLQMPRGALNTIIQFARKHDDVTIIDNRFNLPAQDFVFKGKLRPYQVAVLKQFRRAEMGVVEAGTGAGKTIIALGISAIRQQPTLVLVHTKELLHQWRDRVQQFLGIEPGIIGDGKFDIGLVTVATVQTARKHLPKLAERFGHVIVDECHRVPSSTFNKVVQAFPARYILGLSATPYRRDGLGQLISWYCGSHKVTVDSAMLRETGAVLMPRIACHETSFTYEYNDDYQRMLSALVSDEERNRQIAGDITHAAQDGNVCLVVSDRINHLEALQAMTGRGVLLTGKTPARERTQTVQSLRDGKITVLFSTFSLIGEGFDAPCFSDLFLASPLKYRGRLLQVAGRILRPQTGKAPVIHDYLDIRQPVLRAQARERLKIYDKMKE